MANVIYAVPKSIKIPGVTLAKTIQSQSSKRKIVISHYYTKAKRVLYVTFQNLSTRKRDVYRRVRAGLCVRFPS